jgi:hypothetical protein
MKFLTMILSHCPHMLTPLELFGLEYAGRLGIFIHG